MKKRLLPAIVLAGFASLAVVTTASAAISPILVQDDQFSPKVSTAPDGFAPWGFMWDWDGPGVGQGDPTDNEHNVVQNKGLFRSGPPTTEDTFQRVASAGRYPYYCEVHRYDGMTGTLRVAPSHNGLSAREARVRWASASSNTGNQFDVQFRVDSGPWEIWKEDTRRKSAVFGRDDDPVHVRPSRDYDVRARSEKRSDPSKRSGWSPPELGIL